MKFYRTYYIVAVLAMAGFWALIWAINSGLGSSEPLSVAGAVPVADSMQSKPSTSGETSLESILASVSTQSAENAEPQVEIESPSERPLIAEDAYDDVIYTNAGVQVQRVDSYDQLAEITATASPSQSSQSSGSASSSSTSESGLTASGSGDISSGTTSVAGGSVSSETTSGYGGLPDVIQSSDGDELETDENLLEQLRKLDPLPKIHYFWALNSKIYADPENEVRYELARITHALSVLGGWTNKQQIDYAIYTCASVNETNPHIKSSLAINYSPWHWKFRPDLDLGKPIPNTYNHTIFNNPTFRTEIDEFIFQMNFIKDQVDESNKKYESDVEITAILLDCERFQKREYDSFWNEEMSKALDAIHLEAVKLFPKAEIEWYGRGIQWDKVTPYWTGQEQYIPTLSCSLYSLPKMQDMERWFQLTCQLADELNIEQVTPWVALASGYQYDTGIELYWEPDWQYNPDFAYQMGMKINSLTDSYYGRAQDVIFLAPFNNEAHFWANHFVAYCKGAATKTVY